ncbi:hypothetical protein EJ071_14495 [Mesorhizobium sp. M1B.F.Ca.ET.045.04.1.1]|nr:hypothetical protein EJ071_14495 [Mesorhizobium sp. M1B.F.Ca.ET.045.04.1.1]RWB20920.1 MAG: hypothetical protein EOQ40_13555 [Mesorhizobium sp.]
MSREIAEMVEYIVDELGRLVEVPVFRPVIYTSVYGSELYYDCLRIFLLSLEKYGNYRGSIKIASDRTLDQVLEYVPNSAKERVLHTSINHGNWMQRYNVEALGLHDFSPILHIDSDIVVNRDINQRLHAICSRRQVCVTTEVETYPELAQQKIAQLPDQRRIGNWWGLEILRSDPSCSEAFLPLVNGGIMGFSDHSVFSLTSLLVAELYKAPAHAAVAEWFGDQPFLNYVLVKTKLGEYDIFGNACSFSGSSTPLPQERLGFAHFLWARDADKPKIMKEYFNYLTEEPSAVIKE